MLQKYFLFNAFLIHMILIRFLSLCVQTFVVIGKKFRNKNIFRFSATPAFFILKPWNIVRRAALYIATHQLFDLFIILTILVNCVFLTMPELSFAETSE